jgi:tetratricopeptide (TPR) repeat protein
MPRTDIDQSATAENLSQAPTLQLPTAPASESGAVKAWEETVTMLTYAPAAPDPNPLFLEKRVYQGSSGRVYPLPVIDAVATEPRSQAWKAIHIENEFLRLMVLPEIGGRIHVGVDKRTGYDFFYRQNVIKPALVGLAGPWISGGVEFNWPQHHRPSTFMPVETAIERGPDGSVTIWCSDHDPMGRMKGMHGICLRPGKAVVELRVRLYNRTQQTQTFLWWANMATRVHERYRSFFPQDVRFAADHAKRAVTEYPLSQSVYYGIDYAERANKGVPPEEMPSQFRPDGSYPPNDLGWYANIPVPTSYMIVGSQGDFFGGYDDAADAGTVAYANHHISPGKKQWTWGNHDFGYAWDRNLTDADGPYIELMSGVYTDNQPDFSFLAPGETKTFRQFWYPISEIGVPDLANLDAALRVEHAGGQIRIHLQSTRTLPASVICLFAGDREIGRWQGDLDPLLPLHESFEQTHASEGSFALTLEQDGNALLHYAPGEIVPVPEPAVATEPPQPGDVPNNDELFLIGLHLEQYRHPTRSPEPYWREALRRDAGDSRAHLALGRWNLQRGEFVEAEAHLRAAIARLTSRNPNPYDGEPHYYLGLALRYQDRIAEAYDSFYKSTWNAAWRGPAYHRLAEIDCMRHAWNKALNHLDRSLRADTDNLNARNLKVIALRKAGCAADSAALLAETLLLDRLDIFSRWLDTGRTPEDGQQRLDLAFDLLRAGQMEDALAVVSTVQTSIADGTAPLLLYVKADILHQLGREAESAEAYRHAANADAIYVFPNRLEEMFLLERAIARSPEDARAPYYLGNLLYDRRRYEAAIAHWERATTLDPAFPTAWRNLGFGYFNVLHDKARAERAFENAHRLAPADARILYEQDQLLRRTGTPPELRLARLEAQRLLVDQRDNLSVELASLYNTTSQPRKALDILLGRQFQPWEGGEGLVLSEYVRANVLLAIQCLHSRLPERALEHLQAAWNPPHNLAEAKHLLMNLSMIDYWLGEAYAATGNMPAASTHWQRAASKRGDFRQMQVQPVSETTYWSALALRHLGHKDESRDLFEHIRDYAQVLDSQVPKIDYFATSLPAMLLFDEDLKLRQTITARFLKAQALLGLGEERAGLDLLTGVCAMDNSYAAANDLLKNYGRSSWSPIL